MQVHPTAPSTEKMDPNTLPAAPPDSVAQQGSNRCSGDDCSETLEMRRELGLFDSISVIIGVVSGSGIFISPRGVLEYSGSVAMALLVWALSGVVSLVGAITFAELATMIPESGGIYTYIRRTLGPTPGFVYLWMALIIEEPTMRVVDGYTFGYYILQPFFPHDPPVVPIKLLAAVLIVFLAWVNCCAVKVSVALQDVLMIPKILILGSIIITGIYRLVTDPSSSYEEPFQGTCLALPVIATAFYQGLYTYDGWDNLNMVVEEMKNPSKTFPLASGISLIILTVVFVLTNVAYFAVLPRHVVSTSTAVAVSFGESAFGVMAWAVPVSVAISALASLNGQTFTQSRVVFVGARAGHLPKFLALINIKTKTPIPAIMFMTVQTLLMLWWSDIYALINYVSFSHSLSRLVATSALLWLRYKNPEMKRPFKVWLVLPVMYLAVTVLLVSLPVVEEPVTVGVALGVIAAGIIFYYVFIFHKFESKKIKRISGRFYRFVQILFQVMPEKKL
ncbi:Y+L amino acid transporter 2-like [Cherax quadricarinatus]|uniref:Y+L amino acid transporter 2-like n=1 Tax=Cherax quadricarinatus TaxID=27406 RepID=UPI00237933E1|nr:Y+L amino acid transporter 2-like [Cherax quadricarinatus]